MQLLIYHQILIEHLLCVSVSPKGWIHSSG